MMHFSKPTNIDKVTEQDLLKRKKDIKQRVKKVMSKEVSMDGLLYAQREGSIEHSMTQPDEQERSDVD